MESDPNALSRKLSSCTFFVFVNKLTLKNQPAVTYSTVSGDVKHFCNDLKCYFADCAVITLATPFNAFSWARTNGLF